MSVHHAVHKDEFLPPVVRRLAPYWALALAVFAAYGNVYDNGFLFDDNLLIELNSYLQSWTNIGHLLTGSTTGGVHISGGFYRPIQMLLYLVIYQFFGPSTLAFHLLNVCLHIANTCCVYWLGTKLNFNRVGAFIAAAIWGLHPLHTEAVTYMSATADPLFSLFCLGGIIYLLPDFTLLKIYKSIPIFLLAIGSKETSVMFPLLVMSTLFYTQKGPFNIRIYARTLPLWFISLTYTYWRSHAAGFDGPQTYEHFYNLSEYNNLSLYAHHPVFRFYTFLATLPNYLYLMVWPQGLHMERSFSVYTNPLLAAVLGGAAIVLLSATQIAQSIRKKPYGTELSWGLLWFASAHVPDTGILIPMNSLFLEHWMYLPSVGLFLGIGETLSKIRENKSRALARALVLCGLIFAIFLAERTYAQNTVWRDAGTFYTNVFTYHEPSARGHNNLALYYSQKGDYANALAQYTEATKIADIYAETRFNMALTYLQLPDRLNHTQDAIDQLNRSIEINPDFYRSYLALAEIYTTILKNPEKAQYYRDRALVISKLH